MRWRTGNFLEGFNFEFDHPDLHFRELQKMKECIPAFCNNDEKAIILDEHV
jgi:hypothetical protein